MVVRGIKINHDVGSCWFPHIWDLFQDHCCPCKFCTEWKTNLIKLWEADGRGLILLVCFPAPSWIGKLVAGGSGLAKTPVLRAVVHSWVPAWSCLCSTPSRAQLPPHLSCSGAPHTSPPFLQLLLALPTPSFTPSTTQLLVPFLFFCCWTHLPPLLSLILPASHPSPCMFFTPGLSVRLSPPWFQQEKLQRIKQPLAFHSTVEHHASVTLEGTCKDVLA